jgi:transcriptional regulator with XRE-family HTH domain
MTSEELKTLREACGLSQRHLSDMAAVNERTVRYWESGKSTVPEDVEALVAQLDETLETAALAALTQARTLAQTHGAPEVITRALSKCKQASRVTAPLLYIIAVVLILAWPSMVWLATFISELNKRIN